MSLFHCWILTFQYSQLSHTSVFRRVFLSRLQSINDARENPCAPSCITTQAQLRPRSSRVKISRWALVGSCMKQTISRICSHRVSPRARDFSRPSKAARMSKQNLASADDFEEHVQSTSVPGKKSTKHFPSSAKPNACKDLSSCYPSTIWSAINIYHWK